MKPWYYLNKVSFWLQLVFWLAYDTIVCQIHIYAVCCTKLFHNNPPIHHMIKLTQCGFIDHIFVMEKVIIYIQKTTHGMFSHSKILTSSLTVIVYLNCNLLTLKKKELIYLLFLLTTAPICFWEASVWYVKKTITELIIQKIRIRYHFLEIFEGHFKLFVTEYFSTYGSAIYLFKRDNTHDDCRHIELYKWSIPVSASASVRVVIA